jgi:hypothetical protein
MKIRRISTWALGLVLSSSAVVAEESYPLTGDTRVVYIAADEVDWNYAPDGNTLQSLECCGDGSPWLKRADRPPIFKKAIFREYTDESFRTMKARGDRWAHAGILGPIIHAEVGDRIEITLKNNTSFPVSLHAHGVQYLKPYEGATYPDGTTGSDQSDGAIAPGDSYTYRWQVPTRSGPGPADASSVVWLYHAHVDSPRDINTGLVGAAHQGWRASTLVLGRAG